MQGNADYERHMAMLTAAIPYVSAKNRPAITMVLQANTLWQTASQFRQAQSGQLHAADLSEAFQTESKDINPEGLLLDIQAYCTPKEKDLIQMLLNFIRAGKLMRSYQEFQQTHPLVESLDLPADVSAASFPRGQNQFMAFLLSHLQPEQKILFEQMQQIMYNERCTAPEGTTYDTENELADA